nr:MAG TPA_asm: hypothetical protein [Caudoviricetes sp.]
MKNYAMISKNRVIGVLLNQEIEPEWGPTPDGSPVTAIPCDDTVMLGMIYDPETGTFSEYTPPEPEPKPSQLDRIEEQLNALAADSVTVEKLEAAISEGVNEV